MSLLRRVTGLMRRLSPRPERESGLPEHPPTVVLEVTNACNLRCRLCHFHGEGAVKGRPVGTMAEEVWRPAIEQMASWKIPVNLQTFGAGEPLLHRDLWRMGEQARATGTISFGMLTNGMLMDDDAIARVFKVGMDWVHFSVDGCDRAIFEHYRRGADMATVERAVRAVHAERERRGQATPRISLNMVRYPELEGHEPEFLEHWRGVADEITVSVCRPVGERTFLKNPPPRYPCKQPEGMLIVAWDGSVVLCCEDIHADVVVGRFPEQSLLDIWHGDAFRRAREAERDGDWDAVPICRECHGWSTDRTTTREENGYEVIEGTALTTYRPLARTEARP